MRYDAIVVGAGMAGLTAAAYLRKAGKTVLVLEKNGHCGGLVRSFKRKGFVYDAGVRALLDAGIIGPMLKELGLSLDMVRSKVTVGVEADFVHIETKENLLDYQKMLIELYPESAADVVRIIKLIKTVMKNMDVLYGIENPLFHKLLHDWPFLFGTVFPWLFRFWLTIGRIYRMSEPVETTLAKLSRNQSLQDIIDQHFFRRTPAFFAMSYFSLYLDYQYPKGGTGVLAETLYAYNQAQGSQIQTGCRVVSVDPQSRTVKDSQGTEYAYKTLLWAADAKTLYRCIDPSRLGKRSGSRLRQRFSDKKSLMDKHRGGDSVFTLFLGVELPPAWFAAKAQGHLFYTPDRRGLNGIHTSELDGLLAVLRTDMERTGDADGAAPAGSGVSLGLAQRKALVLDWLRRFCAYNSYEISIPVLRVPTMAPPGQTGLIISVLFEHELCALVERDGWFDEFRLAMENEMLVVLERSVYPGLSAHIIDRFSATPLTIERAVGTADGAITGWAFTGGKLPAVQKIQQSTKAIYTGIPLVYQAGQWSYSPSGVPIAILSAKIASTAMLKALRRKTWLESE